MFATALLLIAARHAFAEPESWQLRGGYWEQVRTAPAATTEPTMPSPVLDRAEQYVAGRQYLAAKRVLIPWIKAHPKDPLRDRAVFLLGQSNFGLDDRVAAYYNFEEVLDLYPDSKLFNSALQREYDIADDYLNGHKKKFLGMHLFNMEDEGVEMMYRIQQRSPGSPLAEKALLRTGDYYYRDGQFDLASDVYAVFAKTYPRSPETPTVRLRQAFSYYAQFRGLRFDVTPIIDAREQLLNIVAQDPKLAEQEKLGPVIARIDETFARKLLLTGDYYQRVHQPAAAAYMWRFLRQTYPKSEASATAQKKLSHLPQWALQQRAPPPAEGYGPSTAPVSDAR
jgi:outer membrane protein assembly factor BamD (BamD/ComL family)